MMKDAPLEALKRPNLQGKTPYHVAAELEDTRFLEQLLRKIPGKDHIGKQDNDEEEGEPEKDEKNREEASDWIIVKDSRGRSPIFNTC